MGLASRMKAAENTQDTAKDVPNLPAYTPSQQQAGPNLYQADQYGHPQSRQESKFPQQNQQAQQYEPYKEQVYQNKPATYQNQHAAAYSTYSSNPSSPLEIKLRSIIAANRLEPFYDSAKFAKVLAHVQSIDYDKIAREWRIAKELAYDLAPLALYDIVFYVDDSGSMAFEEGGERIDDLKFILSRISDIATMFDDDGVLVRFMNSNTIGDGVRNAHDVQDLIARVAFNGMTPLGTNFDRKVVQPLVIGQARAHSMNKPVLAIIITDGEPSGESRNTIVDVIHHAKEFLQGTQYGSGALAVQIGQVGKDLRTQKFLASLDNHQFIGDMIDCTSYFEMEAEEYARKSVTLTPELWLLKLSIGAIDPSVDEQD